MFGKKSKIRSSKSKIIIKKKLIKIKKKINEKKNSWTGMRTYDRSSEENHWQGAKTRQRLLITLQERGTLLF